MFLCAALLLAASVFPAAAGSPEHANAQRTLGGHIFLPSSTVSDPFINSFFRSATGLSVASDIELPVIIIDDSGGNSDTLFSLNGDLLFLNVGLELQSAIGERWALSFAGFGASRIGTSGASMLSQGVTAIFGGDLGVVFKLWQNDRAMVSLDAKVGYLSGLAVSVGEFLEAWLVQGATTASLVTTDGGTNFTVGARTAWAANQWIGIKAAGLVGSSALDVGDDDLIWRLGVAADFDFKQKGSTPIGIVGSFELDGLRLSSVPVGTAVGGGLGVFYTGEERFVIGVEVGVTKIPYKDPSVNAYPVAFRLALRYFF